MAIIKIYQMFPCCLILNPDASKECLYHICTISSLGAMLNLPRHKSDSHKQNKLFKNTDKFQQKHQTLYFL